MPFKMAGRQLENRQSRYLLNVVTPAHRSCLSFRKWEKFIYLLISVTAINKLKLSLCMVKHDVMNICVGVEV
jgi:hypothetical protein